MFSSEAIALRHRLKDCAERLMFYNPIDYGRKVEDIIWRKCYYDPVQICRQQKEVKS